MPLDAVCLTAVLAELRPSLLGARVDKVQQPEGSKLLLSLRGPMGGGKLLLAVGSGSGRLHLTGRSYENPQSPPMFCMLLRKHLTGSRLAAITQPPVERIVLLEFDTYNELGEPSRKTLVLELLGKLTNLILVDDEGIILDALRRVDEDMSRTRRILPGLRYHLPDSQGKLNPLEADRAEIEAALAAALPDQAKDKWLLNTFNGLSPLLCRELAEGAQDKSPAEFVSHLLAFSATVRAGEFTPYLLTSAAGPMDFSYTPIHQYGTAATLTKLDSFSALLDEFYESRDRLDRHRQQAGALQKTVTNLRDRTARKLEIQRKEQSDAENRERFREQGDILTANLHLMQKGQRSLTAQNFYNPDGGEITIPLDPLKTPQQNAQALYKRYAKAKTAERHLSEQIQKGQQELEYQNSVLEAIAKAETTGDVAQIREELTGVGLLRAQSSGKRQKPPPARPLRFVSSTGIPIYAGKNNVQNDQLTFKTAHRGDTWLHVQKIHGSHVIIETAGAEPDTQTLEEAAVIAAFYSQGRAGSKIPVDYTIVKHVKKPSGGKPGAAHYVNYKTIFADPDEETVNRLRKEK